MCDSAGRRWEARTTHNFVHRLSDLAKRTTVESVLELILYRDFLSQKKCGTFRKEQNTHASNDSNLASSGETDRRVMDHDGVVESLFQQNRSVSRLDRLREWTHCIDRRPLSELSATVKDCEQSLVGILD